MTLPVIVQDKLKQVHGRELTDKQQKFLEGLIEYDWDFSEAMKHSGYNTSIANVTRQLKNEIIELAELMLIKETGKSVNTIVKVRDAMEHIPNAATKLTAATTILDRVGLGKKEKIEIDNKVSGGLFIIPAKRIGE